MGWEGMGYTFFMEIHLIEWIFTAANVQTIEYFVHLIRWFTSSQSIYCYTEPNRYRSVEHGLLMDKYWLSYRCVAMRHSIHSWIW